MKKKRILRKLQKLNPQCINYNPFCPALDGKRRKVDASEAEKKACAEKLGYEPEYDEFPTINKDKFKRVCIYFNFENGLNILVINHGMHVVWKSVHLLPSPFQDAHSEWRRSSRTVPGLFQLVDGEASAISTESNCAIIGNIKAGARRKPAESIGPLRQQRRYGINKFVKKIN